MKRLIKMITAVSIFAMISAGSALCSFGAEHDEVPSDGEVSEETAEASDDGAEGEESEGGEGSEGDGSEGEGAANDISVDIGDGRYVKGVYADDLLPAMFHKETIDFRGQTVECAKFDKADITLLYTTDAAAEALAMLYDPVKDELTDVRIIRGVDDRFIIVLSDCDGDIPAGYTKAVLDWNGQTLTAFMEESVANGSSVSADGVDPADFFLLYAMSSEGNKGWYRYDKNELTYQRFLPSGTSEPGEAPASDTADDEKSEGMLDEYIPRDIQSILLIVCAPLALILLTAVIILAVKLHEYASDYGYYGDDMYDIRDDEEDGDEDYVNRRRMKPGAVTAASLVGKSFIEEDEEDDDEDEYPEGEDEDMEDDDAGDEEDDDDDEEDDDADEEDDDDEDDEDEDADEDEDDDADEDEDDEDDGYPGEDDEDEDIKIAPARKKVKRVSARDSQPEDDVNIYTRPMTRRERRELEREEKWRQKEEKKAAKRRMQGYEEATPMDWSSFETGQMDISSENAYKKVKPPKYMTESLEKIPEEEIQEEPVRKKKLPPRKIQSAPEEEPKPQVVQEEEMRQKQRRLFEQQQRIEEMRRIEAEQQEEQRKKEQQQFISTKIEDEDLDEDFQFEFLNLN